MKDRSVFPEFSRRQFLGFGAVTAAAVGVTMAVGGELRGQSQAQLPCQQSFAWDGTLLQTL